MTTHIIAVAQNNSTFVWTLDFSQVVGAYPALASSNVRMQIKTYPTDAAALVEFVSGGSPSANYNGASKTVQFLAPQSAVATIAGQKYFDIRVETPAAGEFVCAYGTLIFAIGPTVSGSGVNASDASTLPDTVIAKTWEQLMGIGVNPVSIDAVTALLAQAAADEAAAAASATAAASSAAAAGASGFLLAAGGAVRAANAAALPAFTYANGTAGVGATITGTSNGALPAIDGVTLSVNDRLWHWDYTGASGGNLAYGIYTVTQLGDGSHPFILTRATDADTPSELGKITAFIANGSANAGKSLAIPFAAGSITVGTTALNPGVVSGPGGISAEAAARAAADTALAASNAALTAALAASIVTDTAAVDSRGYGAELLDGAGRVVLGFDGEGELRDSVALIAKIAASLSPAYGAAHEIPTLAGSMTVTDWHGLSGAGQSNMEAHPTFAAPALTTTQPYTNKRSVSSGALAVLVETSYESCMSAACNALKWRTLQERRPWSPAFIYQWIATNMGAGGADYNLIKKGSSTYNAGITEITNTKAQAVSASKTYAERALLWHHGEADTLALLARATYAADIQQFYTDWNGDVMAITGQSDPIPMFIAQLCYSDFYTDTGPTLGMLDAVEANPNIFIDVPGYALDFTWTDGTHYPNYAQRLMGEYHAKAIHRYWIERRNPSTVRPLSWKIVSSTVIEMQFYVPVPPLVFDLDTVWPGDLGLGFAIYDGGGAEVPIADARITAPDKVRITVTTSVAVGYRVTYAIKTYVRNITGGLGAGSKRGARGCLRDNDSSVSLYPDANGNILRLPNWCVAFDKVL